MKKIIIMIITVISLSAMLASCTGNTVTDGNTNEKPSSSQGTEKATEKMTDGNIIDEAESRLEDMSEDATHGVEDGTMGGDSTRGGIRRGK